VGRNNVVEILKKAQIDGAKRLKTLTEEEQENYRRFWKNIKPKAI